MKIWAFQGPHAGRPLIVTEEEGQAAIDAGWAQPLRGSGRLQKPDRVTVNEAANKFAEERKTPVESLIQTYPTREMRSEEQPAQRRGHRQAKRDEERRADESESTDETEDAATTEEPESVETVEDQPDEKAAESEPEPEPEPKPKATRKPGRPAKKG